MNGIILRIDHTAETEGHYAAQLRADEATLLAIVATQLRANGYPCILCAEGIMVQTQSYNDVYLLSLQTFSMTETETP